MISLWKRLYGASPLHLLGQLVAFAVAVYAFEHIIDIRSTDNTNLFVWFIAGALLHDLIFVPVYLILDLITRLGIQDHALRNVRLINHIRVPVAIAGVTFLTTFSLILGKNKGPFLRTAAVEQPDYVGRWLLICAIAFGVSAVAYAVRMRRDAVRRTKADASPPAASVAA